MVTGVGPGAIPYARCDSPCCGRTVKVQIRTRYNNGYAELCAAFADPEVDPDVYHTELTSVIVYHRFNGSLEIGSCTYTIHYNTGPSAIISGGPDTPFDCGGEPPEETTSPDGCTATMNNPPATHVVADPADITYAGGSASEGDVCDAALGAMVTGDWSDWGDLMEVDAATGYGSAGYDYIGLSSASCGSSGSGSGFSAHAGQFESELRVLGAFPISIAVSEGPDPSTAPVYRYTIEPGIPKSFSAPSPSFASGWVSDLAVLRCVCPVQFAAA